jgi:catechol 2,3-dioxygenase-like lactoylglutathione lyase family enzyme
MENIVSEFVGRYERGGLTRRQLISGLAALAATAHPALAGELSYQASSNASVEAPYSVVAVGINHVGINVSDVARSVDWYVKMFGLVVLVQSKDIAVLGYRDHSPDSTSFVFRTSSKPEVNHIMFGIDNFNAEALAGYLKQKGLTLRNDVLSFHIQDPDGIDVQVGDKNLHPSETVLAHK